MSLMQCRTRSTLELSRTRRSADDRYYYETPKFDSAHAECPHMLLNPRVGKLKAGVGKLKNFRASRGIFFKNVCPPWPETMPVPHGCNNRSQLTTPKRVHATLHVKTFSTLIPVHFGPFFQRQTGIPFILFVSDLHLLYKFRFAVD